MYTTCLYLIVMLHDVWYTTCLYLIVMLQMMVHNLFISECYVTCLYLNVMLQPVYI